MFIDEVKVRFVAWKWGDWCVAWRREKCIPNGWPYWWTWWKWWDVVLRANPNENTLWDFRHRKLIRASNGINWDIKDLTWANWEDLIVDVPVWTLILAEDWELIYDLDSPWSSYVLCRWWRGWIWNAHFASSTRQAPWFAELWDIWEDKTVRLELKLVADIAIVWLPNAWKSTLIKSLTSVKPKIADYPFTTIIPNLWILEHKWKNIVIEDVPWLIKWASEWKWLWHNFLRHIERAEAILHLLDLSELDSISDNYNTIRNELSEYSEKLSLKEEVIVLSKADLFDDEMIKFIVSDVSKKIKWKKKIFVISSASQKWIDELKDFLASSFWWEKKKKESAPLIKESVKIYDLKDMKDASSYKIKDLWDMHFEVTWDRIEQIVRMTNMNNYEAIMRVYDVMKKVWILKKVSHTLNTKYKADLDSWFFEWENETAAVIEPKIYISWRCFPLDKFLFD